MTAKAVLFLVISQTICLYRVYKKLHNLKLSAKLQICIICENFRDRSLFMVGGGTEEKKVG